MRLRQAITEEAIPALLEELGSPWGSAVTLDLTPWAPSGAAKGRPDYRVRLRWADQRFDFAAECKSRSTPRAIDEAVVQARRVGETTGLPPMIIVPYLDDRRLNRLVEEAVSGIDLSGNGIAIVPGRLLLRQSGRPNRYPESHPTKYAYRGATSIVPRVFLCRRRFESVSAIKDAIEARGGSVALSTVSKALARMAEDVLIERAGSRTTLVQPDALLDKLRDSFRTPATRAMVRVRIKGALTDLFKRVNGTRKRPRLILSGSSSRDRYAAGRRSGERIAYCEHLREVRDRAADCWEEGTERFADLTIIETSDRTPFFDARHDRTGLAYASPVQAYLELAAGAKKDRETADAVRELILGELESGKPVSPASGACLAPGAAITLEDLRQCRGAILELAARHGATNVRVFGSLARGSAGPSSDVDLLVEIAADRSLLDHVALIQDLSELLGRRVDVVSDRGLNPRARRRVLEEAVPL